MTGVEKAAGDGPRPARGYSWPPFEPGNQAATKHGFHSKPRPDDLAELEQLRDAYRAALGARYHDALEPAVDLAASMSWRLRRAYSDLSQHGLVREGGSPAPLLKHISSTERSLVALLDRLALTSVSEADLGLTLVQVDRLRLDRLSPEKRRQLEALLAEVVEGDDDAT